MSVLLDTTVLIDVLKGEKKAIEKIEEMGENAVLYTTVINIYEILRGIKILKKNKEKHFNALKVLIKNLHILEIDLKATEAAADIYAELRKRGVGIDEPDYLIAGACLSNGIDTIVTRNEKHFNKIKSLKRVIGY